MDLFAEKLNLTCCVPSGFRYKTDERRSVRQRILGLTFGPTVKNCPKGGEAKLKHSRYCGAGGKEEVITMKIQFQTNNGFPLLTVADERVLDFLNVSAVCRFLKGSALLVHDERWAMRA